MSRRELKVSPVQRRGIQVAYANSLPDADRALLAKAAMAHAMGMKVAVCGTRRDGKEW